MQHINSVSLFVTLDKYLPKFLVELEPVFAWSKWLLCLQFLTFYKIFINSIKNITGIKRNFDPSYKLAALTSRFSCQSLRLSLLKQSA